MNVLFVTSEISPYASTGGLADVGAALPTALLELGEDIWRVMPMYRKVLEGAYPVSDTGIRIQVPVGLRTLEAEVWKSDADGPATYFIRKDEFFDRSQLYSLPERDYDDNFERFVFFQKAVVGLIDHLDTPVDIVHANDWQTALIPYFLTFGMQGIGRENREHVVFTIHNMAYQGVFEDSEFPYSNLPYSCFSVEELEFYGKLNCMKGAINRADQITTVSERYAEEILRPEFGCGLEGVLADARDKLTGIVNGVDYEVWDPQQDPLIAAPFSASRLEGKQVCKQALLERMGLSHSPSDPISKRPLIGMVSRLVDQKGMDLLVESMDRMMEEPITVVILGSGQEEYQRVCRNWAEQWPDRFAVYIGYNNELAHQIEAAADLFLMPSQFEPCGLNQLYSLRYGTVPIVHAVGGLDDTIEHIDPVLKTGNGFKFHEYTQTALIHAFQDALRLHQDQPAWRETQKRIMQQDYSWHSSARAYQQLYQRVLKAT